MFNSEKFFYKDVSCLFSGVLEEVYASSVNEVIDLVNYASMNDKVLYPISTGMNWGLGSKAPTYSDSIVVNLSRMNKILDFNEETGIIVVEPGVTQGQIFQYLSKSNSRYFLDVTGSSRDSSLIGNSLERGITYNGLRVDSVMALEVVTGNSEVIHTGNWRFTNSKLKYEYRYGVGPDLTGLFFQSNFGIVTKMAYQLKLKPEINYLLQIKFKSLKEFSNSLSIFQELVEEDVINSVFHVGNVERIVGVLYPEFRKKLEFKGLYKGKDDLIDNYITPFLNGTWNASGVISGPKRVVKHKLKVLKKKLRPYAKVVAIRDKHLNILSLITSKLGLKKASIFLECTRPFRQFNIGMPSDAALGSLLDFDRYKDKSDPSSHIDNSKDKFIFCLPLSPLDKESCEEMVQIVERTSRDYLLSPSITLNIVSKNILEAVVSFSYKEEESSKATSCVRAMQEELARCGYYCYRTNISDMDLYFKDKKYSELIKKLKRTFDPKLIISRGRYDGSES